MKIRILIASTLLLSTVLPATAKKKVTPLPAQPHTTHASISSNYIVALSTANRFLQAWQTQDHEAGLLLLSDPAKQQTSAEHLEEYFAPESSTQRAYQITQGSKLKTGRYTFPITLIELKSGSSRTRNSRIFVVQTGKDDWAVDKLP